MNAQLLSVEQFQGFLIGMGLIWVGKKWTDISGVNLGYKVLFFCNCTVGDEGLSCAVHLLLAQAGRLFYWHSLGISSFLQD